MSCSRVYYLRSSIPRIAIPTATHAISDVGARFIEYESKIQELKSAFVESAALRVDVTVFRMMNAIPDNGMCPDIHYNVTLTDPGFQQRRQPIQI